MMRTLLTCLVSVCLAETSLYRFETARALYNAAKHEEALKQLELSEQEGEKAPLRQLYRGMSLAELGRWQEGRSSLEGFVKENPANADAWYWLGASQYYTDQIESAHSSFDKALELRPNDGDAYRMRGLVRIKQNRWNQGYQDWVQAARLNPRDVKTLYYLGRLFQEAGQAQQAKVWLMDATRIDPRHFEALTYLGMVEEELGKTDAAAALYERAVSASVERGKPFSWAYTSLAQLRRRLGNTRSARELLEQGVQLAPEPHLLHALAKILVAENESARAEEFLRKALQNDPQYADAHYQLGLLLTASGRREEAAKHMQAFQRAKQAQPRKPKVTVLLR